MENHYNIHESEWNFVESIIEDFRSITKVSTVQPKRMVIGTAEEWKWKLLEESKSKDIKLMIKDANPEERDFLITLIKKKDLTQKIRDEGKILEKYRDDLSRYLNVEVVISQDPVYSKKALPGRPAIRLE